MTWSEVFKSSGLMKMTVLDSEGNLIYKGLKKKW